MRLGIEQEHTILEQPVRPTHNLDHRYIPMPENHAKTIDLVNSTPNDIMTFNIRLERQENTPLE